MNKKIVILGILMVVFGLSASYLYQENRSLTSQLETAEKTEASQSVVMIPKKVEIEKSVDDTRKIDESSASESDSSAVSTYSSDEVPTEVSKEKSEDDVLLKQELLLYANDLYSTFYVFDDVKERNAAIHELMNDDLFKVYELPEDYALTAGQQSKINQQEVYFGDVSENKATVLGYLDLTIGNVPQKAISRATLIKKDGKWKAESLDFEGIVTTAAAEEKK